MKRFALGAVALAVATSAYAAPAPKIIYSPQNTALPGYTTATIVEPFDTSTPATNGTAYTPKSDNGVYSESVKIQGRNQRVSIYTDPLSGMDGQYIGITNGASYTINFDQGVQFFSFAFNNLGTNDKLTLTFADGTSTTLKGNDILILTGGAIIGDKNNALPTGSADWGRVSYDFQGKSQLVSATFSSGSDTWFIDSIAFAAPEPGAWAMMIAGFGLAGWQLRSRRRKKKSFALASRA